MQERLRNFLLKIFSLTFCVLWLLLCLKEKMWRKSILQYRFQTSQCQELGKALFARFPSVLLKEIWIGVCIRILTELSKTLALLLTSYSMSFSRVCFLVHLYSRDSLSTRLFQPGSAQHIVENESFSIEGVD